MARSRRRSASRNNSASRSLNAGMLAKIGTGLLAVAGGTYGVFYAVSTTPSDTLNRTEGVQTGTVQGDLAMSQKPALPDEPTGASMGMSNPGITVPASFANSGGTSPIQPLKSSDDEPFASNTNPTTTRNIFADGSLPTVPTETPDSTASSAGNPATDSDPSDSLSPNPADSRQSLASQGSATQRGANPNDIAEDPAPPTNPAQDPQADPLADILGSPGRSAASPEPARTDLAGSGSGLGPLPGRLGANGENAAARPVPDPNDLLPKPRPQSGSMAAAPPADPLQSVNPVNPLLTDSSTNRSLPTSPGMQNSPSAVRGSYPDIPAATNPLLAPGTQRSGLGQTGNPPALPGRVPAENPGGILDRSSGNSLVQQPNNAAPNSSPSLPNALSTNNPSAANSALSGLPGRPDSSGNGQRPGTGPGMFEPSSNSSFSSNPSSSGISSSGASSASSLANSQRMTPPSIPSAANQSYPDRTESRPSPPSPSLAADPPDHSLMADERAATPSIPTGPTPRRLNDPQVRPANHANPSVTSATREHLPSLVSNQPGDPRWEIQQNAAVILEKHAPEQVQVNVPAKFILAVRNVGRVPAAHVLIRDRIPAGARMMQATPKPDRQNGDLMEWDVDTLPPGETLQITMELMPTQAGELGSVAEVSLAAVAACRTRSTQPKLVVEHTAPPQILKGQPVVMNITVRNDGDGPAENVVIRETVPQGLKHQSGAEIENPIGRLLPGQSRVLQLPLLAVGAGKIQNTIRVTGDGKLSDEHTLAIEVVSPQLKVDLQGPDVRFLSRQTIHQMEVQNTGTANATNVQMMARLPRGLKYESSSPAGRYDPARHAVFWAVQQLPSGKSESLSITTLPLAPGEQSIEFQALADLNQPQSISRKLLVEQLSELFFEIDDVQDPIEVNSNTTYVIRLENQGSQVANNVSLIANLPPGIEPLKIDAAVDHQIRNTAGGGKQIVFAPIAVLNPEQKLAMQIQVQGQRDGDHRVEVQLTSDQRPVAVAKQETTKVYSDVR